MATKEEVIASLTQVNETLTKVSTESTQLLAKIDELQAVIDAGDDVPEEVATLVAEIRAKAASIDELVPDATQTDPNA